MNIQPTEFSAVALYEEGRKISQDKHKEAEEKAKRTLRVGSSGCLLPDGSVLGTSPWKALARFLGYQIPITDKSFDIFDGGYTNESMWDRYLRERGTEFTGESNYPLRYEIEGVPVTGRPDLVILNKITKEPVFGIELKGIMSLKTAQDVLYGDKPKDDNFIQAAHYCHKFNLPWILCYTSNSVFEGNYWTKKNYGVESVPPFSKEFKIGCEDGKFYYITESGIKVPTLVTVEGIEDYYRAILESAKQRDISWMQMSEGDIHGVRRNYDLNLYDDLCLLVSPNTSFDNWVGGVETAFKQTRYIKTKKVAKEQVYRVYDGDLLLDEFKTVEEAREFIFGGEG